MANWSPQFGQTLLIPSGPRQGQMHLHVVLNDPKPFANFWPLSCALACICSVPESNIPYETTREFGPGAHKFIVKQSYVHYKFLQVMSAPHLITCVNNGTYTVHAPFLPEYVTSIIDGYVVSRRVPGYLKGLQF